MAGIGFALRRMFNDDSFTKRGVAYIYSSFIAAGPWIISVIAINLLLFFMEALDVSIEERNLLSATIVYSFLFSQLLIAPFQLVVTRYLSDKLYISEYGYIRPSFMGFNQIIFFISLAISVAFYFNKPLPLYYRLMAIYLFVIISLTWVIMIYLSAVKNYKLIVKAYIIGGLVTFALMTLLIKAPLPFEEFETSSNFLFSYLIGLSIIFLIFLYNFLTTFFYGNGYKFDFLKYFNKFYSLFFIGLFYTGGIWVDNIVMWFSELGLTIQETFLFAPYYDNAIFLSYLTIIPSLVLFLVFVETDFYNSYKNYFQKANGAETYKKINLAFLKMKKVLNYNLFYSFEVQALITLTAVLLAKPIFKFLKLNYVIRNIFKITAVGSLFNILFFTIMLILLYFELKKRAMLVAACFFFSNLIFSFYLKDKGVEYFGYGFAISSFITFCLSFILYKSFMNKINYITFARQPIYIKVETGIFVKLSNYLNRRVDERKIQDFKKAEATISPPPEA